MLAFNKEVLRMRKIEAINREKQSFLRWGQKMPINFKKGVSDSELSDDPGSQIVFFLNLRYRMYECMYAKEFFLIYLSYCYKTDHTVIESRLELTRQVSYLHT